MDAELAQTLAELHRRGREHDGALADRLERYRNIEPDTAALLAVLIRTARPRRVLELGTSNGYSTIWLADAVRAAGGHLASVDIDPQRTRLAEENLRAADLRDWVQLINEDATDTLAHSPDGSWDLILLDAERPHYAGYWPELLRVLAPSGLLAVDNALSHAEELEQFRAIVAREPSVIEALAPTGAGLLLIVREWSGDER